MTLLPGAPGWPGSPLAPFSPARKGIFRNGGSDATRKTERKGTWTARGAVDACERRVRTAASHDKAALADLALLGCPEARRLH